MTRVSKLQERLERLKAASMMGKLPLAEQLITELIKLAEDQQQRLDDQERRVNELGRLVEQLNDK